MILITGASGYLGGVLARQLHAEGHALRLLVRRPERAQRRLADVLSGGAPVELVTADLGPQVDLTAALQGVTQIYHAASQVAFHADAARMHAVNVGGTEALCRAALATGVQRLVHVSSLAAGGPALPDGRGGWRLRREEDPPQPLPDPYGQTKLAQERVVQRYVGQGLAAVIVRPAAIYGPGHRHGVNELARLAARGLLFLCLGPRATPLNLVPVDDVVAVLRAAMTRGETGAIYHAAGPNAGRGEWFARLNRLLGRRPPWGVLPAWLLQGVAQGGAAWERTTGRQVRLHPDDVANLLAPWAVDDRRMRELGVTPTDPEVAWGQTIEWLGVKAIL